MFKANDRQVGGSHYKDLGAPCPHCGAKLEHWDLAVMFKWDYLQGQIIKYVMRWRNKLGIVDLKKGRHNLDKYIETAESEEKGEEAGATYVDQDR